jgi:hypothetical protein
MSLPDCADPREIAGALERVPHELDELALLPAEEGGGDKLEAIVREGNARDQVGPAKRQLTVLYKLKRLRTADSLSLYKVVVERVGIDVLEILVVLALERVEAGEVVESQGLDLGLGRRMRFVNS